MGNKTWQRLVAVFVLIAGFIGCTPKNNGNVCDRETADSIHIGDRAFAMDSDSIVQLCNVRWKVNSFRDGNVCLFTSTLVDSPEMKSVVQLIDSICGKHDEVENLHFCWNELKLRRCRSERNGGTMIILY